MFETFYLENIDFISHHLINYYPCIKIYLSNLYIYIIYI